MRSISFLLACAALTGCAGLEMKDIQSPEDERAAEGFRYYDTSPFLLVYTDGKGGLKSELLYLPDSTKKRSIRPFAYGAKNDTTLKFENGRMVGAKAVVDETAVPVAAISALEKVATSLAKAANSGNDGIPPPYLYRIRFDGSNWTLSGGQAIAANGQPQPVRYVSP